MKYIKLAVCLMFVFIIEAFAFAADEAISPNGPGVDKVAIRNIINAKETREYKIETNINGKMPVPDLQAPLDLDVSFLYRVKHYYSKRDGDGLLPLNINMIEGQITAQGEKLNVSSNTYPKLTVLLDRNWRFDGIFGATTEQLSNSIPGISYNNLIILFYLYDGDTPHAVGDKWESNIKLPGYGGTYKFVTTFKSIDEIDGIKVAAVHQDISWIINTTDNKYTAQATASAESKFALSNGKLIKSQVDCKVVYDPIESKETSASAQQAESKCILNTKINISLVK